MTNPLLSHEETEGCNKTGRCSKVDTVNLIYLELYILKCYISMQGNHHAAVVWIADTTLVSIVVLCASLSVPGAILKAKMARQR